MRAREPSAAGAARSPDGVRIAWESFGAGEPAVLLLPSYPIIHSRQWKAQVHDLSRRHRVVTYDGRGNGGSDRPTDPEAYQEDRILGDLQAVLDATAVDRAVFVGLCYDGVLRSFEFADACPDRVLGIVAISVGLPFLAPPHPWRLSKSTTEAYDTYDGWRKENIHYWRRDYADFADFYYAQMLPEPHSTKVIEDCVEWTLDGDVEAMVAEAHVELVPPHPADAAAMEALVRRVRCPVLIAHGTDDRCQPIARAERLAELTGAPLVRLDGAGHIAPGRHPVTINLLIRDFITSLPGQEANAMTTTNQVTWTRSLRRPKRALYISSPIGLGHAQRDVGIADELRKLHPELQIDWLAQHPVTAVLGERGERLHPRSAELANESAHIAAESSEHDLNAFQAIRRMDEILVANFMVFHDAVTEGEYDLVIGDEAWDIDHFLHENPELKRTAFAWMTDFVGWLPMPEGGDREAFLTADYNAEMIEHVERFPRIRDRAIFVGDPEDIVPDDFGPGLPGIRDWTERHYAFSGYVTGFDPSPLVERREELRRELGYRDDERVVIVTVGGSGVGESLLRRVVDAYPEAARRINGLRMIAVAGPRIDPASLAAPAGVEVRGFVPELYKHLAVCDLAVVQGGLTTTMELTAAARPFLYFPLRNHFEQNRHVRHRLERYGAGRFMEFASSDPDAIATAMAEEIDRPVAYRPVARDGARRAAELIAPLI
jgi:pimeloyl-ACP methyl ester carboxylesterase/predicted glycosyltransferase